jgi:hypothetical protein
MGKVPVGRTISEAYRFLTLRPGAVVGLGWLPAVFYGAAIWFCLRWLGTAMQAMVPSSSVFNEFTVMVYLATLLATALLVPTAAVPFAAAALGGKREAVAAHFVYGGREFRLSLALLGFYFVVVAVLVALGFAAQFVIGVGPPKPGGPLSGFGMPAMWYGIPLAVWLNGAAAAVLAVVALFLSVRFGFYLSAVAAAEEHVSLGRAWVLSRRNFWRLAVVHLVLALPVSLAVAASIYFVEGESLASVLRTAWTGVPSEGMNALYRLQYDHAGALAVIWAVGMLVATVLFSSASATAYRVVALGQEEAVRAPARTEPDLQPAWAAAKAMADAGPQWRHDPFVPASPEAPAEAPPDAHALASEAAATTYIPENPPAEYAEAVTEPAAESVQHEMSVSHDGADEAPMPAAAIAAAEPVAQPETAADVAQPAEAEPSPEPASLAPPLDPAGVAAAMAAHDQPKMPVE